MPAGSLVVHIGGSCPRCDEASTCRRCPSSGTGYLRMRPAHDTHVFSTRVQTRCHCGEAYYDAEAPLSDAERFRVDL